MDDDVQLVAIGDRLNINHSFDCRGSSRACYEVGIHRQDIYKQVYECAMPRKSDEKPS